MKRSVPFLLIFLFTLVACGGSSEAAIATGVAATLEANVVQTAVVATQRALDTPTPELQVLCAEQAKEYLEELERLEEQWFDAVEVADSTSRISLSGPVGELQTIKREIEELEGPECASGAGNALFRHAEYVIEGFLLFMQDEPESLIESEFNKATTSLEAYYNALEFIIVEEPAEATRASESATRDANATATATSD